MQHGVCMSMQNSREQKNQSIFFLCSGDVQWNKNQIFNLCLTVGYFWTTLLVMIVLYIFIYGIQSDLPRSILWMQFSL